MVIEGELGKGWKGGRLKDRREDRGVGKGREGEGVSESGKEWD